MSTSKLRKSTVPFEQLCRETIQSIDDLGALAIWVYLSSKPEGWTVRGTEVQSHFNIGRERYRNATRKLRELGLIEDVYLKGDKGHMAGQVLHVHAQLPGLRNNRTTGFRAAGKPAHIENTDSLENTDLIQKKKTITCALFEKWWEEYPKKVAKKACLARWRKLNLEDNGEQLIADVCKRVKKDRKWIDGYAPNPLTYLNGERWHDDIEPVTSERPVNGAPKTHSQWHQWCRKNGYGDGPIGFSEAKFISWATEKYRRQQDVR